jgi:hypothetical protein
MKMKGLVSSLLAKETNLAELSLLAFYVSSNIMFKGQHFLYFVNCSWKIVLLCVLLKNYVLTSEILLCIGKTFYTIYFIPETIYTEILPQELLS